MQVIRLYTGKDGESHFEDMEIPLHSSGVGHGRQSEPWKATGAIFVEIPGEFKHEWHTAPRRQMVIRLAGTGEIEIGDGTKRQFAPGDILLAEDTTGRGHRNRSVSHGAHKNIIVTLE